MTQKFLCEVEREDGLTILSVGNYIVDPDEMLEIAYGIIDTVTNYRDEIDKWNKDIAPYIYNERVRRVKNNA